MQLAGLIHGFKQRLITIAQIGTHPDRCLGNGTIRPLPIR